MSESQLPEKYSPKTLLGKALVDLDKVELPEMIEKNLIRSACRLITGVIDIPVAWLKSVERNIGRETEALDLISKSNSEDITKLNSQDNEFIQSTANYYTLRQFKEASNRRKVLNLAINNLNETSPLDDVEGEIDEDWLDTFSRTAETKSSEEVQIIFSKILAGEIRRPGTFKLSTIQTLSVLDKTIAEKFINLTGFCMTARWTHEEDHNVIIPILSNLDSEDSEDSDLDSEGMDYGLRSPMISDYSSLIDAGLVRYPRTGYYDLIDFKGKLKIGCTEIKFKAISEMESPVVEKETLFFTTAGLELSELFKSKDADETFLLTFVNWVEKTWKLKLTYISDDRFHID